MSPQVCELCYIPHSIYLTMDNSYGILCVYAFWSGRRDRLHIHRIDKTLGDTHGIVPIPSVLHASVDKTVSFFSVQY